MKTILSFICAMVIASVSVVFAQNATEQIKISGMLVNGATSVDEYTIEVRLVGNENRLLEELKPEEDGSFLVSVASDRAVRLVVLDKRKEVVFRRTFIGSPDNHKIELKEIDLSKAQPKR